MLESRQDSDKPYPPKSLYSITVYASLHRTSHSNGVLFNFLDKGDVRFGDLHCTQYSLDSVFNTLPRSRSITNLLSMLLYQSKMTSFPLIKKIMPIHGNPANLQNMTFFYLSPMLQDQFSQ